VRRSASRVVAPADQVGAHVPFSKFWRAHVEN
jgi:hypothetical protein